MFQMLLSLCDVLLLVHFINRWELHCRPRKQVLILSVLALSVAVDWYLLTYLFHAYIFHPCKYLRLQYLHFPTSGIAQFHTYHFLTCVFQYFHFQRPNPSSNLCIILLLKIFGRKFLTPPYYTQRAVFASL